MMMTPEQFLDVQKANLEKILGLSQQSFNNVEKVVELNLNAVKTYMEDSVEAVKALAAAKDMQEFMAVSSSVSQPMSERVISYSKDLYTLSSGIASDTARLMEEQVSESNKKFVELFETASRNAPAGTESAMALMKSAMTAANNAYDSVSKATKQAVEMAEANIEAAAKANFKNDTVDTGTSGPGSTSGSGRARKAA